MNNYFQIVISLFFILIFISSCSIEKRVHLPGYHVEWHQKKKVLKKASQTEQDLETHARIVEHQVNVLSAIDSVQPKEQIELPIERLVSPAPEMHPKKGGSEKKSNSISPKWQEQKPHFGQTTDASSADEPLTEPTDQREFSKPGMWGFIFSLVCFGSPILGLVFLIPAFICSVVGVRQAQRMPSKYRGKNLYLISTLLSGLAVIGVTLALLFPELVIGFFVMLF